MKTRSYYHIAVNLSARDEQEKLRASSGCQELLLNGSKFEEFGGMLDDEDFLEFVFSDEDVELYSLKRAWPTHFFVGEEGKPIYLLVSEPCLLDKSDSSKRKRRTVEVVEFPKAGFTEELLRSFWMHDKPARYQYKPLKAPPGRIFRDEIPRFPLSRQQILDLGLPSCASCDEKRLKKTLISKDGEQITFEVAEDGKLILKADDHRGVTSGFPVSSSCRKFRRQIAKRLYEEGGRKEPVPIPRRADLEGAYVVRTK